MKKQRERLQIEAVLGTSFIGFNCKVKRSSKKPCVGICKPVEGSFCRECEQCEKFD